MKFFKKIVVFLAPLIRGLSTQSTGGFNILRTIKNFPHRLRQFPLLLRGVTFFLCLMSSLFLVSCATDDDPYAGLGEQNIYYGGQAALADKDYEEAVGYYEALEAKFPYGAYAYQESLNIIYAYYQNEDYTDALTAAQRFIHFYPTDPHVDYAYYMQAMSQYAQSRSFLERYFAVDPSERDITPVMQAFEYFDLLVENYPSSIYVHDARLHMVDIRNGLARNNLLVAEYYYSRGALVAAINRAGVVVLHYQGTPSVLPALQLLLRCYHELGLTHDENLTRQVLKANFPNAV